jgi:hypothetical protein
MRLFSFVETNPAQVIFLRGGQPVLINELVQYNTYNGLIFGVPKDDLNQKIPGQAADRAKSRFGAEAEPVVIAPQQHSFSIEQQQQVRKPGGEFEAIGEVFTRIGRRLPKVTCMVSLRCPLPLVEQKEESWFRHSLATVVWFQETFAFPIDAEVMAQIRELEWGAIAVDASD